MAELHTDTRSSITPDRLGANYFKLFGASTISNLGDGIGVIAYPWLASAITRNPLLIAIVAVAQRLPWLLFSLPAGVITDRYDRRVLLGGGAVTVAVGFMSWWPAVWLLLGAAMFVAVLWNVITVSFRQTVIPDHLLGRVNSVYRFFGWGMMPIGAALGGLIVVVTEQFGSREFAQRMPWFVAGTLTIALFAYAGPRLTTAKFAEARAAALADTSVDLA